MLLCVQRALLCHVSLLQVNSLGVHVALCAACTVVMCVLVASQQLRGACCSVCSVHCCVMCVLVASQQLRGACCSVCSVHCCVYVCPCCKTTA